MIFHCHILHCIKAAALLAATLLAVSSCGSDIPSVPDSPSYQLGLTISVGEPQDIAGSRAPGSDDEYDPGSGYENYIDVVAQDFCIALYDTNDNYLGKLNDIVVVPLDMSGSSKRYQVMGSTSVNVSSGNFKITMLANWGSDNYPAEPAFDDIWPVTYKYKGPVLGADNLIPLYGVKEVNIAGGIEPNRLANMGTLHLIRAMAKIEVILNDPTGFWQFKTLQLTRYNTRGYNAPSHITDESQYVKNNWYGDYISEVSVPADPEMATDLDFEPAGDNHYLVYVPEYANASLDDPEQRARIRVEFQNSLGGVHYIDIINERVNPNKPVDINRNVWYKITITKTDEQSTPVFEVDVIPYKLVDLEPIFGLD